MADHYEYKGLSEKAKDHAIAKLKEDPLEVNEHIERFRNLLKSKPHLGHPTDSNFLLKFLRVAKFDYEKAVTKLDNFCTLKCSPRGIPEYFSHLELHNPWAEEFLENSLLIPLGRNENGDFIILIRSYMWNPDTMPLEGFLNMVFMFFDMLVEEEETQIFGIKFILDLSDMPLRSLVHMGKIRFLMNINRIIHDAYPFRVKGEIMYNEPQLFDIVFKIYSFFLSEKTKKIITRVKGSPKDLIENVPGIEKLMPTEYGGGGGPLREISEKWNKKFKNHYKDGNPRYRVSVDEAKRPAETVGYLKEHGQYTGPTLEME